MISEKINGSEKVAKKFEAEFGSLLRGNTLMLSFLQNHLGSTDGKVIGDHMASKSGRNPYLSCRNFLTSKEALFIAERTLSEDDLATLKGVMSRQKVVEVTKEMAPHIDHLWEEGPWDYWDYRGIDAYRCVWREGDKNDGQTWVTRSGVVRKGYRFYAKKGYPTYKRLRGTDDYVLE